MNPAPRHPPGRRHLDPWPAATSPDHDPAPWHDLVDPTPAADPSRATRASIRDLRRHLIQNTTMAGAHLFVSVVFGWTAATVVPADTGHLLPAVVLLSGNSAVTAVVSCLGAITAARALRQQPVRPFEHAATWLNRLHLSAALTYLLHTAITRPATTALALIPIVFAATSWILWFDTRDSIRRCRHRCPGCADQSPEGAPREGPHP